MRVWRPSVSCGRRCSLATASRSSDRSAAARPRYVALLFDDVHTRHADMSHARVAAERFVGEALQPGDRVAIFTTSGTRAVCFARAAAMLAGAIKTLSAHPRMSEDGVAACPRITPYQAY